MAPGLAAVAVSTLEGRKRLGSRITALTTISRC